MRFKNALLKITIIFFISVYICLNGFSQSKVEILNNPNNIKITELTALNSVSREANLSISPDGNYLLFMSDRGGMAWSTLYSNFKGKPRYDGDIWYSHLENGKWKQAICIDNNINTASGEDEPNISPDGQYVTYQSWKSDWETSGGPYYTAVMEGNKWTSIKGLGGGIAKFFNTEFKKNKNMYATDGMTISPNKKTFIVACGSNYNKDMDLFISKKENNIWSYCKKMKISTKKDERSVFIAGDGNTIFFASNGYGGYGGMDIFKTTLNIDGTFGEIYNIGKPFNTKKDDYGFILTASGNDAYFIRNGDIYHADLSFVDNDIKPKPTVIINGTITDETGNYLETFLELVNKQKIIISDSKSNLHGEYSFVVPSIAGDYKIISSKKSKYDFEIPVSINEINKSTETKIQIKAVKKEEKLVYDNANVISEPKPKHTDKIQAPVINFDFNKDVLNLKYNKPLNVFIKQLSSLKSYKIEIIGHTDNKGNEKYNEKLGQKRAENVREYLINNGIDSNNITTSSKGEKIPVASNLTDKGSYSNRRVVIIVKPGY